MSKLKKVPNKFQFEFEYIIIGIITTLITTEIYYALTWTIFNPENIKHLLSANLVSWILSFLISLIIINFMEGNRRIKAQKKEEIVFYTTRFVGLFLDMGITLLGITFLKLDSILIKLFSQALVITLHVFPEYRNFKMKIFKADNLVNWLICLPIIDFITSIYAWNNQTFLLGSLIKGFIFLIALLSMYHEQKNLKILLILCIYFLMDGIYIFANNLPFFENATLLLKTFFFPVTLLYFKDLKTSQNQSFFVKVFFIYLLLLIVPKFMGIGHNISEIYPNKVAYLSFFYSGNELSATLLCLTPIVLDYLRKHQSWLVIIICLSLMIYGFALLRTKTLIIGFILTILYFGFRMRKSKKILGAIPIFLIIIVGLTFTLAKNFNVALNFYGIDNLNEVMSVKFVDKVLLSSRLTYTNDAFKQYQNTNLSKKVFGLGDLSHNISKNTEIDLFDIFFSLGLLGTIIYLYVMFKSLKNLKLTGIYAFSFYLTLFASFFSGHILTSPMVCIWLSLMPVINKSEEHPKKILMISNMYPSKKAKHYGSFVKNMEEEVRNLGYEVTMVKMTKHRNFLSKLVAYLIFYLKGLFIGLFGSFDIMYVHFISHSTLPVLFGYIWSRKTKLILNAHGNDIVADTEEDIKNVRRSHFFMDYADLVVVPSKYFKKIVHDEYYVPNNRIVIYPSGGIDLQTFQTMPKNVAKQQLGLDPDTFYIGCVSRIEKDKGYDNLVEAIYMLKEEPWMEKVKVIIIGTGKEHLELEKLINQYHLQNFIMQKDFVYQEELVTYYNAFDLFIFPTKRKSESLGLVGLEAMACHTPIIACDLYGPSQYLKNGENSLTYQKTTTGQQLAKRIKQFYNMSETEKNCLIANGYKTSVKYSTDNIKRKLRKTLGE